MEGLVGELKDSGDYFDTQAGEQEEKPKKEAPKVKKIKKASK
jgi:hypothetical protein